jgi:3-hydroxyacyl-CoA dehydrogenase
VGGEEVARDNPMIARAKRQIEAGSRRNGSVMNQHAVEGEKVALAFDGAVAVVTIDNPPVNAGSSKVRSGLLDAFRSIAEKKDVKAAMIIGGGRTFIAGSDIREFDRPLVEPQLPAVIAAIEACPVPVVAAIHGNALGGGFELALGCDARIARADAFVGLPEVTLGLIPGAGGTQRLPRLAGIPQAIEMFASGRRVPAPEALSLGLLDRIVAGDLRSAGPPTSSRAPSAASGSWVAD